MWLVIVGAVRNWTSPSDDANFDPPKFAPWAGRAKVLSIYGISTSFFFPLGVLMLMISQQCEKFGYHEVYPYTCGAPKAEAYGYMVVSVTSLHCDVLRIGRVSFWHTADRILAQLLGVCHFFLIYALCTASPIAGFASLIGGFTAALSYKNSYAARDWWAYEWCHTIWHVVGTGSKALAAVVLLICAPESGYSDAQKTASTVALLVYMVIQLCVCSVVWSLVRVGTSKELQQELQAQPLQLQGRLLQPKQKSPLQSSPCQTRRSPREPRELARVA